MKYITFRFVLVDSCAVEDIDTVAWAQLWSLHDCKPRISGQLYEKIWLTEDQKSSIHYVEDPLIGVKYIHIDTLTPAAVARIIEFLPVVTSDETIAVLETSTDVPSYVSALYRLGVGAPSEFDPQTFGLIVDSLLHSDARVRRAAVLATGYVGWREFKEPLERLRTNEPDAEVRQLADRLLASLTQHNWSNQPPP
jgi:hypothetical protein